MACFTGCTDPLEGSGRYDAGCFKTCQQVLKLSFAPRKSKLRYENPSLDRRGFIKNSKKNPQGRGPRPLSKIRVHSSGWRHETSQGWPLGLPSVLGARPRRSKPRTCRTRTAVEPERSMRGSPPHVAVRRGVPAACPPAPGSIPGPELWAAHRCGCPAPPPQRPQRSSYNMGHAHPALSPICGSRPSEAPSSGI